MVEEVPQTTNLGVRSSNLFGRAIFGTATNRSAQHWRIRCRCDIFGVSAKDATCTTNNPYQRFLQFDLTQQQQFRYRVLLPYRRLRLWRERLCYSRLEGEADDRKCDKVTRIGMRNAKSLLAPDTDGFAIGQTFAGC